MKFIISKKVNDVNMSIRKVNKTLLTVNHKFRTPTSTPPATTPAIDAAKLYADNCAACHQANRQGLGATFPPLTPASLADDSIAKLVSTITNGKSGTMPPFNDRLTAAQINALATFIKTVNP